jgi:hypothetical protein
MPRNQAVIPGRRALPGRLPYPDARTVLGPGWPGPAFWQTVLADADWWWTYNLPPVKITHLREARHLHLITGVTQHTEDHSTCPTPRPLHCDRFAPQAWHGSAGHSDRCPHSPRRMPRVTSTVIWPTVSA